MTKYATCHGKEIIRITYRRLHREQTERIVDLNYNDIPKTIRNVLRLWNRRDMSLHGKVHVIVMKELVLCEQMKKLI